VKTALDANGLFAWMVGYPTVSGVQPGLYREVGFSPVISLSLLARVCRELSGKAGSSC
jgi:hypothetical protein